MHICMYIPRYIPDSIEDTVESANCMENNCLLVYIGMKYELLKCWYETEMLVAINFSLNYVKVLLPCPWDEFCSPVLGLGNNGDNSVTRQMLSLLPCNPDLATVTVSWTEENGGR